MSDESGRPQDQGRRHRKRATPSPETASLLAGYQAAMRTELRTLLEDIAGRPPDPGLLGDQVDQAPVRPSLKDRAPMWDLAIKIGRELGTSIDPGNVPGGDPPSTPSPKRRTGRIDFG